MLSYFVDHVQYIGCFNDDSNEVTPNVYKRLFDYIYLVDGAWDHVFMNNDVCIMICREKGFLYAGTEVYTYKRFFSDNLYM